MIVRELVTRLGFSVNDANLRKYEGSINNIKSSAENAANSFRSMFAAFVGFSAAKSIAKTADEMQSMEARVGMLPQTVGLTSEAFDAVGARATAARQSIDAYGNLYIKLQNAGKDFIKTQEDGLKVTDTLSKALIVGGATAQEQSSAMLQFAQAIGSGVLQGDEMRAMAEAAPQFMDELAKAIGVPRDQIKKMGSEGKLTSKVIIEAVQKMSGAFEEKFKQMPMTINQAITIGGNKWAMFINRLNRKSGTVTSIANFLLAGFDKLEKGLDSIVDFFGGATQAVKTFAIVLAAAFAPAIIGLVIGGLMAIFSVGGLLFAGLLALGLVIEDVYQYFNGGESVLGDFIAWLKEGSMAANILITVFVALTAVLSALAIGFTVAWFAALSPIMLIIIAVMALYAAFLFFKDEVSVFMADLWKSITDGFFSMIEKLSNAWTNFKSFFTGGVNANVTATTAAGASNPNGPMGGARSFGQNVTINQTLPPGSTPETAAAAKGATMDAMKATDNGYIARQMGAYE